MRLISVLFLVVCVVVAVVDTRNQQDSPPTQMVSVKVRDCEPIAAEMCKSIGYNVTAMPNLVGHETQRDAEQQLMTFNPLIQYGCSTRLPFFLCSTYFPMCTEKLRESIGPCRPLCESIRQRCEPVLNQFGFPWPIALNCSKFPPDNAPPHLCMEGPPEGTDNPPRSLPFPQNNTSSPSRTSTTNSVNPVVSETCDGYHPAGHYIRVNRTQSCALRCDRDGAFTTDQKRFADYWMATWAGLCFVATAFTVLTFLVDSSRHSFLARTTVIVAFCYNVCSVAYIVRLVAGREAIACRSASNNPNDVKVLVQEGQENADCMVVFLLVYYFWIASNIWWVVLTLLLFLVTGLRWSVETVCRYSTACHVIAWSVPAVLTVVVLVLRSVDADELTAMCFVGYGDARQLAAFVIAPLCVCILVGGVFIVATYVSVCRRHDKDVTVTTVTARCPKDVTVKTVDEDHGVTTNASNDNDGLTRHKRLVIYALFYAFALVLVLASTCYEYISRATWYTGKPVATVPNAPVLGLKLFASLIVGVTSPLWFCSAQSTLQSWQTFVRRLCRCARPATRDDKTSLGLLKGFYQKPVKVLSPNHRGLVPSNLLRTSDSINGMSSNSSHVSPTTGQHRHFHNHVHLGHGSAHAGQHYVSPGHCCTPSDHQRLTNERTISGHDR